MVCHNILACCCRYIDALLRRRGARGWKLKLGANSDQSGAAKERERRSDMLAELRRLEQGMSIETEQNETDPDEEVDDYFSDASD